MTTLAAAPKADRIAALQARLGRLQPRMRHLPGSGALVSEPAPGVSEVLPEAYLDSPAAFSFLAALAARAASENPGPLLFAISEQEFDFGLPSAAGLAAFGLPSRRLMLVRTRDQKSALWALEEGARTRGLAAVLALGVSDRAYGLLPSRRLVLASERTGIPVLVLRAAGSRMPSNARLRWRIAPAPGAAAPWPGAHGLPGLSARRWRVTPEKAPGASHRENAPFEVEWNETALRFDPPAALVRRPDAARIDVPAIRAA